MFWVGRPAIKGIIDRIATIMICTNQLFNRNFLALGTTVLICCIYSAPFPNNPLGFIKSTTIITITITAVAASG